MRRLVTIDLTEADLSMFEGYERKVLALLPKYGGRLEMRVRTRDQRSETHLLFFPDAEAYNGYLNDPARLAAQSDWEACGARSAGVDVEVVEPAP